jgi:hypothetical protein
MKKILVIICILISINSYAQIKKNIPPTNWHTVNVLKSNDTHCVWDTITFNGTPDGDTRQYRVFDNGVNTNAYVETKTGFDNWVNNTKYTYTNDNLNRLVSAIIESWQYNHWINNTKYNYKYDDNNRIIEEDILEWEDDKWEDAEKTTWTYDQKGNILTKLEEIFCFSQIYKNTYSYDSLSHLLSETNEFYEDSLRIYLTCDTYIYDKNGNNIKILYESFKNDEWKTGGKDTLVYDNNGKLFYQIHLDVDSPEKKIYSYNNNGYTESIIYEYLSFNDEWIPYEKDSTTYDMNGNILTFLNEFWYMDKWCTDERKIFTYDNFNNSLSCISEDLYQGVWSPHFDFLPIYSNQKSWVYCISAYSYKAHWRCITTGINEPINKKQFSIYPNPANSQVNIYCQGGENKDIDVIMYDLIGREVTSIKNRENNKLILNTSALEDGIYFIKLLGENINTTKKLIIKH